MKQSIRLIFIFISLTGIQFSWAEEKNEPEQAYQLEQPTSGDNYYAPCRPIPDCGGNSDQTSSQAARSEWLKWLELLNGNSESDNEPKQKQ
ncbi:hypothetical protein [Aliikangiella coralliicola]|uniref:Uncharacterized protein n=1 Tax=Aliikangiella coralliicola TaxID=2592383 RepID=A0A545UIW4_9GAMM|nr:hypothetical protein [Aliikangiella coralliicola]TQV89398.1 hypothetical protein FLL46_00510 [Aliikangiella coralliicola]